MPRLPSRAKPSPPGRKRLPNPPQVTLPIWDPAKMAAVARALAAEKLQKFSKFKWRTWAGRRKIAEHLRAENNQMLRVRRVRAKLEMLHKAALKWSPDAPWRALLRDDPNPPPWHGVDPDDPDPRSGLAWTW